MPSVECSICSEEFGKRTDSSAVIATKCGHVFHEVCLSKWLEHCKSVPEPETCPECRQPANMSQTQRIYFHSSTVVDNLQDYVDYLSTVIAAKSDKLQTQTLELEKMKLEWLNKIRERDFEIQRLNDKLKSRESEIEIQTLNAKMEKLRHKFEKLKQKHAECSKIDQSIPDTINFRENGSPYMQLPYMAAAAAAAAGGMINSATAAAIRTHQNNQRGTMNQLYNHPVPSTSTISQPNLTNTNAVNTRPILRNPLTMYPGGVQAPNTYNHNQQAILAPTHQENFFTPNMYNPTFYNANNHNHFY